MARRSLDKNRLVIQRDLSRGLNSNSDILHGNPGELLDCQNMLTSRPNGIKTGKVTPTGALVSFPSSTEKKHHFSKRWTVATFNNSINPYEDWTLGSRNGYAKAYTEGYQSLMMVVQETGGVETAYIDDLFVDIPAFSSDYYILVDRSVIGTSNFNSAKMRLGKDSSNYYEYTITSGTGQFYVLANGYTATVGTPGTRVNYVSFIVDGKNKAVTRPTSNIYAVVSGSTTTVATTEAGDVWYSYDCLNWVQATIPSTGNWHCVTYGNGTFVLLDRTNGSTKGMISTNGVTWTAITVPSAGASDQWTAACWGDDEFVAISWNGNCMISEDGETWISKSGPGNSDWVDITYGNGTYVAVSHAHAIVNNVATRIDGTWTNRNCKNRRLTCVEFGNGKFVCASDQVGIPTNTTQISVSNDGITWKKVQTGQNNASFSAIKYANNVFCVVQSNNGVSVYSEDGETWSTLGIGMDQQRSIDYNSSKGYFVSTGNNSHVFISPDGKHWQNNVGMVMVFDDLHFESASASIDAYASNITNCFVFDPGGNVPALVGQWLAVKHSDAVELHKIDGATYKIKTKLGSSDVCFTMINNINNPGANMLVFADGLTGVYAYDPYGQQTVRQITDEPYKYCCAHNNALFLTGSKNDPYKIAVSNGANDYFTFNTENEIFTSPKPYCDITSIHSMDDFLVVGRQGDIWNLYGDTFSGELANVSLKNSKSKTGPLSQKAAVRVGFSLVFFDGFDIYSYDGSNTNSMTYGNISEARGTTSNRVIDRIQKVRDKSLISLSYNKARNCVLVHCPSKGASGSNPVKEADYDESFTLVLNMDNGNWGEIGRDASVTSPIFCSENINNTVGTSFFQCGIDVREWDTDDTEDTARTCMYQHQFHHAGSPGIRKNFIRYIAYIRDYDSQSEPNPISMYFYVNGNDSYEYSCTGYPVNGRVDTLLSGCNGDSISCKITKDITDPVDDALEVSGYDFVYTLAEEI